MGGNVITEDIKEGCSIIEKQAELLKVKFGSAWPGGKTGIQKLFLFLDLEEGSLKKYLLKPYPRLSMRVFVENHGASVFRNQKTMVHDDQKKKTDWWGSY